jgi:pyruvate/2-oxoglutarate dehydrogenase complex dihydrolipoamide acyltransferase (E2) component
MPVEILMPELGESVHEGTVSRWLKKEGDHVKEDEPVVEIMTDKVNTELQAPATGILAKIIVPEGGSVQVFHPMGIIQEEGEELDEVRAPGGASTTSTPAEADGSTTSVPTGATEATAPASGEKSSIEEPLRRWYTPVVRKMAAAAGIGDEELARISGSGAGGRVTKRDIEEYLASGRGAVAATAVAVPRAPAPPAAPVRIEAGPDTEVTALSAMRAMIAEAMVRSAAVPTVTTITEVDVTPLVRFREKNKANFEEQYGVRLTYTPFFLKALTEGLQEFPLLNASLQGTQVVRNKRVHMGVAVALGSTGEEGLIVPVIRDCQNKSVIDLARDLERIATRARIHQLDVADVQGGTFTFTNPGSYGATLGTPMINAPQAAIAGAYAIRKVLAVREDDSIATRFVMNLVLTYDHRLIDGLLAGRFLQAVRSKLEGFEFFR